VSDEIINFYKKVKEEPEEPQKPIKEQKEIIAPVLPRPDEPFDKFLLELAEKLKTEKVITEKQQEVFVEQVQQPVSEDTNDPFKKFLDSFASNLKEDKIVNREENIKEATISFINKLKEEPQKPFIIKDQPFVKTKRKDYLPRKFAKKLPEPVIEEPVEEELIEPIETVEPKTNNKYVQELQATDKVNRKQIPEKIKKLSDIKSVVTEQVTEQFNKLRQMYPNFMPHGGGGGGTNAVQYAKGGTMDGDLNVTGKYLSGGVDIISLFQAGSEADRLISGSQSLVLNPDGSISFPNNFIVPPDGEILNIESETNTSELSGFTRISLSPFGFFAYDNNNNSISFSSADDTIVLASKDEYEWKFNSQGILEGPNNTLTVNGLSSLGNILSGGVELHDIFLTSETDSQTLTYTESSAELSISNGNTVSLSALIDYETAFSESSAKYEDTSTVVQSNSSNWNFGYNVATYVQANSADWEESAEILPTVTNYLSTNSVTISTLNVAGQLLSANTDLFDIFLTSETDSQTLTYTESSAELSISNGNTVSLSALIDYETAFSQSSAKYEDTYTTVQTNSSSWNYQGTDLKELSGNWEDTYTIVQNNSATTWNYQGTDLKEISGNWQSTYETVSALSAQWSQDIQTLSFNEGTQELSIDNGNTVSLSSLAVSSVNIPTIVQYLSSNNISLSGVTLNPATNLSNFNVERVLQDKLTEVISVKDFGAKGDGVANDWLSIQRALSAAAGVARLYIPPGLYMITQELRMPSNTYVYGAGIGTTVIKLSAGVSASQNVLTNSQNTRSYLTNQGNQNIIVKDLELDGNAQRFAGGYSISGSTAGCALGLASVTNALVENVYCRDACNHSLDVAAGQNTINSDPLTYTPGPSQNVYLKNIIASGAGDDNITFHFSRNITIDGFYSFDSSKRLVSTNSNGLEVDDGCYDIVVKNGYVKGCSRGIEIKGHDYAPAAKRVTVYNVTVENCVRNFDLRHLGFTTSGSTSKTAYDVALYNCTSISPLSSTQLAGTATRALKISSYNGVYVKDFYVVGIHDSSNAVIIQENAKNIFLDGVTFTEISGNDTGITEALLKVDTTANSNITLKNLQFRDCAATPVYVIGSVPGVIVDTVDAITNVTPAPGRVVHFTFSPLATPYTIKNVTASGYTNAYRLGGSHNFDYPVPVDVEFVRNIVPASPASANTQYTVARFGWMEGTAQTLNAGIGTRIEFTGNIVSGVSANNDIPIAYIGTEKINSTDTDLSSRLTFGTRPNNTDVPVTRMSITPAGNVGIGTTTPNQLLTVSGNISAIGTASVSALNITTINLSSVTFTTETTTQTMSSTDVYIKVIINGIDRYLPLFALSAV